MATLGTKLVGMDAVPAVLHYEDGGMDGPWRYSTFRWTTGR